MSVGLVLFLFDSPTGLLEESEPENIEDLQAYAIARNASTQYFNEDGSLSYTFKSNKLSHYRPNNDPRQSYTDVEGPDILVYDDVAPWHIYAESARISADRVITLRENVRLEQQTNEHFLSTMTTSKLVLNSEQKLAHTDEAVTIKSHLGEVTAVGMRANMSNKNIKLLSKVRGRHAPQTIAQ